MNKIIQARDSDLVFLAEAEGHFVYVETKRI